MDNYQAACEYCREATRPWLENGKLTFPAEASEKMALKLLLEIDWIPNGMGGGDHLISDAAADRLLEICEDEYAAWQICAEVASLKLSHNRPMPRSLRSFVSLFLAGRLTQPSVPRRAKNWARNCHIVMLVMPCVHDFGLKMTRDDVGKSRNSACDAVATVLTEFGANVSYRAVKELMIGTKPENTKFRTEMAVTTDILARRREARPDLAELWDRPFPISLTELKDQFRQE